MQRTNIAFVGWSSPGDVVTSECHFFIVHCGFVNFLQHNFFGFQRSHKCRQGNQIGLRKPSIVQCWSLQGTTVGSVMDSRRRTWNTSTGLWAQLVALLGPIIPLETPVGMEEDSSDRPHTGAIWSQMTQIPAITNPVHRTTCFSRQCINQLYLLYITPHKPIECYSEHFTGDWQNAEQRKEGRLIHANDNNRAQLILEFRGLILISILWSEEFLIFFFAKICQMIIHWLWLKDKMKVDKNVQHIDIGC